jgi:hypothetical protein
MTDKQKLKKAISALKTLKQDAKLALSGDWDRSDHGFECQIYLIDDTLKEIENDQGPKSKFKQTKLPL